MIRLRSVLVITLLVMFILPEAEAAYYKFLFVAKRDGHVKIWRTKDGVRTQPEPAVDMDMLAGDSAWLSEDYAACNDEDLQWTNAATSKQCSMVGTAYSYNAFGDFLDERTGSVRHYALMDVSGLDITVMVQLEVWYDYLQANPPPDEAQVFSFVDGTCADLPGYTASETASGLSYTGDCEVEVVCTLMRESQSVPSTDVFPAALLTLLIVATGIFWWRRKVRVSC